MKKLVYLMLIGSLFSGSTYLNATINVYNKSTYPIKMEVKASGKDVTTNEIAPGGELYSRKPEGIEFKTAYIAYAKVRDQYKEVARITPEGLGDWGNIKLTVIGQTNPVTKELTWKIEKQKWYITD